MSSILSGRKVRLSSPELTIRLARRVSLPQLVDAESERGVETLSSRIRAIRNISSVNQNNRGHQARFLGSQGGGHECTHRMTHDGTRTEAHKRAWLRPHHVRAEPGRMVAGVVGIAAASQIESEERASASELLCNADKIHVGSSQAMQADNRCS